VAANPPWRSFDCYAHMLILIRVKVAHEMQKGQFVSVHKEFPNALFAVLHLCRPAKSSCSFSVDPDLMIKPNSVALVRKRTIPTERPPLVGEVSDKFCG
jgi:hypothetical protein